MEPEEFEKLFEKYKNNEVTIIRSGLKKNMDRIIFRSHVIKDITVKAQGMFQAHHLLPQQYFPERATDYELGVPIRPKHHTTIHKEYNNIELAIDPLGPVLKAIGVEI